MSLMRAQISNLVWQSNSPMPQQTKERTRKHEIQFVREANLTPRHTTRFSHIGGQRLSAAPLSHDVARASAAGYAQQAPSAADLVASMRAKFNAAPIQTQKLADNLTMLSGPGGSVVVLNGPDGKFVVDTFVAPAWPRLKEALDGLSNAPVKYVIDTHWHFDHTDNNAPLHAAGATVLAHENTKQPHVRAA